MMAEHKNQAEADILYNEYIKALYVRPRDEFKCLELAEKILELTKGTRLQGASEAMVERHKKRI